MELPVQEGMHYFDLYHGVELIPERRGGRSVLTFSHGRQGLRRSARHEIAHSLNPGTDLMAKMKSDGHAARQPSPTRVDLSAPANGTDRFHEAPVWNAPGMVKIPEADFLFKVHGIEIEGFDDIGVDVQYPWEDSPRRYHEHHSCEIVLDRQISGDQC